VSSDAQHLLEASGISKRFAGIAALDGVSLHVDAAEMAGLIGPNGAGKTTLFDCLYGTLRPDRGRVTLAGRRLQGLPEHRRARLGLGRTFQRIELFGGMSPREHLLVAIRAHDAGGSLWRDVTGRGRATSSELERVDHVLELLGLLRDADRPVEALSLGRGRLVELGRALMIEPKVLLLDEPSSGLNRSETTAMAEVLSDVRADRGTGILLVEHDVQLVADITTRLYVLEAGHLIASGPTAVVLDDEAVRRAYLGVTP
jgi:branched-chain amino acid transport system ATP-binding protein